ncbi:hypothetical protein T08_13742 [Trichinella sp. T8]|nr:hypothetical protein T08_13742 [Trichinella sp. T8]
MDDCFSRGRVFVRCSAAYRDQQRLAAVLTYRLHRNEISTEHFSRTLFLKQPIDVFAIRVQDAAE